MAISLPAVRRIGRVSRSNGARAALVAVETASDKLEKLLKSIANSIDDIAILEASNAAKVLEATKENNELIAGYKEDNAERVKQIEMLLKEAKMQGYTDGVYRAEFVNTVTKSSREVDLVKLKAAVKDDVFMQCVKGSISSMGEFLSEREIEAVCNTTPAKITGTVLKVEKLKKGKK